MNLAGACLVMLSLTYAFNLSAFAIEVVWAAAAVFGLGQTGAEAALEQVETESAQTAASNGVNVSTTLR